MSQLSRQRRNTDILDRRKDADKVSKVIQSGEHSRNSKKFSMTEADCVGSRDIGNVGPAHVAGSVLCRA